MNHQLCPLCKTKVNLNIKFPYYLCVNCVGKITDRDNFQVIFETDSSPRGFKAYYKNHPQKVYLYDLCYINGLELKVFSHEGQYIFIQPTDILKFGSRPGENNFMPSDPTNKRSKIIDQILIRKILIPAIVITFLSVFLPILSCYLILKISDPNVLLRTLYFTFINLAGIGISIKLFLVTSEKFPNAKYFKRHCLLFLIIGLIVSVFCLLQIILFNSFNLFKD